MENQNKKSEKKEKTYTTTEIIEILQATGDIDGAILYFKFRG